MRRRRSLRQWGEAVVRICAFCGKPRSDESNKEDIVPLWVHRCLDTQKLGIMEWVGRDLKEIAADSLKIRVCKSCNSRWGKVENAISRDLPDIIASDGISLHQVEAIAFWVEKIKILYWHHLVENGQARLDCSPRLFVDNYVGKFDCIIAVWRKESRGGRMFVPASFIQSPNTFVFDFGKLAVGVVNHEHILRDLLGLSVDIGGLRVPAPLLNVPDRGITIGGKLSVADARACVSGVRYFVRFSKYSLGEFQKKLVLSTEISENRLLALDFQSKLLYPVCPQKKLSLALRKKPVWLSHVWATLMQVDCIKSSFDAVPAEPLVALDFELASDLMKTSYDLPEALRRFN